MKKFFTAIRGLTSSPLVRVFKQYKKNFSIIVLVIALVLIGYYLRLHPSIFITIYRVGLLWSVVILALYFGVLLTNLGITLAAVSMNYKHLPAKEGLLLTIYTSVVNFFGPLQSGPAVRAVYLKTKIGLRIRDYTLATIFYYFAFAVINASLLFVNKAAWLSVAGIVAGVAIIFSASRIKRFRRLGIFIAAIFLLTLVQILLMAGIYTIELWSVSPLSHYTVAQTVSYMSSANLSLFVSLTPSGIGIREAFLIFSQPLHQVQLSAIIAAGIIDRALYFIFLLVLFCVSSMLHLGETFIGKKRTELPAEGDIR